jgi:hypothetical protein
MAASDYDKDRAMEPARGCCLTVYGPPEAADQAATAINAESSDDTAIHLGKWGWSDKMRELGRAVSFKLFFLLDTLGLHVLPKHYYTPVPDYSWLRTHKEAWAGRARLAGVHWDLDQQLQWLEETCRPYYHEVAGLAFYREAAVRGLGSGFGEIDSQVVHCFLRAEAPPRIIEIGGGVSTACLLHGSDINIREGRPGSQIVCIEPYPKKTFRNVGKIMHIEQPCQAVPYSVFAQLKSGDLLFVDSSHAVKVGSDVIRIYMDIIPSLPPGVFIHIHDIYLPYLYPRSVLFYPFAWQETALLLALLTNNNHLSVLACLSALHYDRTDKLASLLSDYRPQSNSDGLCPAYPAKGHFPSSIWLCTC